MNSTGVRPSGPKNPAHSVIQAEKDKVVAQTGQDKFEAQREARMHLSQWADSAASFANSFHGGSSAGNTNNLADVIEAARARFNGYSHVVNQQLVAQITTGMTELVLDAPENKNNRKFLDTLKLPEGYTLRICEAQPDTPGSSEASSSQPHASALDPFSQDRPFAPQGGMAKRPLQELTRAQKESLEPLVEEYANSVKTNSDKQRSSILAKALLVQVENHAASSDGDSESFKFEVAVQVAAWARSIDNTKVVDNKPLRDLAPHLPEKWRELFERDSANPGDRQEYRALMGTVERKTSPEMQAGPPLLGTLLPVVPFELTKNINTFLAFFKKMNDNERKASARAIIKLIGKAAGGPGQQEMAMTTAVGKRLREACAPSGNLDPLICFASMLKGDAQALFLDVLMSDHQFVTAQRTVTKLAADCVKMSDAQFSKFQLKYGGVVSIIGKLPYQTRMMVTNDLNKEIERIASVNEDRGSAIRNLKLVVTDLE